MNGALPLSPGVETRSNLTVVGIGASAGGLEAFRTFFENMPADSGLAFVVVLHLPHDRKSMLAEILARWTVMPVEDVVDSTRIMPNHVYVPPPHSVATIVDETLTLRLRAIDAPREDRPIDGFFDNLAASLRENAIGIVLSGTGSDGALGLKAIKAAGGMTLAQGSDGTGPQYDGMPSVAAATGAVDLVIPVEAMPARLVQMHVARKPRIANDLGSASEIEAARLQICAIVRGQLGHDFSGYKDKTFLRRVQRRMQVLMIHTLADYVARLQGDQEEVRLLFKDLLIRVTSFFRDSETFDLLEREVMPHLFEGKQADDTVRIWVPGCATGEEAYSLAILLREQMDRMRGRPKVQVFATDIDEPAIATARGGRYPSMLLEGMSAARRARFFTQAQNSCIVAKEIRDLCTFSTHSLVRDPPFSRMNMISCRNLLIYLDTEMQDSIIPSFHYSLVKGGILLLGSSESASRHDALFSARNKSARIFERCEGPSPPMAFRQGKQQRFPGRPAPGSRPSNPPAERAGTGRRPSGDALMQAALKEGAAVKGWIGRGRAGLHSRLVLARRLLNGVSGESLERQLRATRDELQSVTEEHETAVEELRSANEELHSVNEELQSTNEELETSKEEIQSVNEELHTVNAQLSEKVDELDHRATDLKNLFDSTQVATIFLDRHLLIRGYTPAVVSIYNLIPSDQGRPLTDIVSHLRYDLLREDIRTVMETLEPLERRVSRIDRDTHYILRILPYRTPDSSVDGALITFLDVTSIVQAETHQSLLVDELNHRVKNMLTVVISLASQTIRRNQTLEGFSDAFMGRIKALSGSYSLLSRANWTDVPLFDVLMEEVRPFISRQQDNITLQGPPIRLSPKGGLAIGMAVHELVTNAVKYGALSIPNGVVRVCWRVDAAQSAPMLVLDWIESEGPAVIAPTRQGFGAALIERGFAYELSGSATIDFVPEGVHATLRAPIGPAVFLPERIVNA